ncbi:hypothetical protein ACFXOM_07435 [Streptomyces sp. NPDC059169]|uniref:hypothetical protein n=1 Tax=Streptomyces sp. NPDC059169 TaxID=3346754 RepID=UPI0036C4233A
MSGRRSLVWLGLTPEPERELPPAVAALRAGSRVTAPGPPGYLDVERRRIGRLILHGTRRTWLRYLSEVTDLVTAVADGSAPGDRAAALLAGEVVLEHHRMLIGLPGSGYDRTTHERRALEHAVEALRNAEGTGTGPSRPARKDGGQG